MLSFKSLLKAALKFVWEKPILWLLGFFGSFTFNNEFNAVFNNFKNFGDKLKEFIIFKTSDPSRLSKFFSSFSPAVSVKFLLFSLFFVLLFFFAIYCQITIVSYLKNCRGDEIYSFKKALRYKKETFWLIVGIYFIKFLIIYGFFYLGGLSLFYKTTLPILVFVLLFSLLELLILFVLKFSIFYIIFNNQGLFLSIKNSFLFFKKHFLLIIKYSFYLFLLIILVGSFLILSSGITMLLNLTAYAFLLKLGIDFLPWLIFVFFAVILVLFSLIVVSILNTAQLSFWTLFFLRKETNN